MICDSCGRYNPVGASKCLECGYPLKELIDPPSPKSRGTLSLLALLLGQFGIHRFYAGKYGTGLIMLAIRIFYALRFEFQIFALAELLLVPMGLLAVWVIIDFVLAVYGKFRDNDGLLIEK